MLPCLKLEVYSRPSCGWILTFGPENLVTPMTSRIKNIVLCLSLALNFAVALGAWALHQLDSDRAILQNEKEHGLSVHWKFRDGVLDTRFPTLLEIVLGVRPVDVRVDYPDFGSDLTRVELFASALKRFGTIEALSIGQGDAPAIERLLKFIGDQSALHSLYCFHGDLSDTASESLSHFPRIKNLAIVGTSFTGAKFPQLGMLSSFDCSYNPTSLAGLRRIAASPSLKKLMLKEPEEGSLEYRKIVASVRSEFPRIKITGIE